MFAGTSEAELPFLRTATASITASSGLTFEGGLLLEAFTASQVAGGNPNA